MSLDVSLLGQAMTKETKREIVAALLGAVSGSIASAVVAHHLFPGSWHVPFSALIGGVVGALAGWDVETIFEAFIQAVIVSFLLFMLYGAFSHSKTGNHIVLSLFGSALLGYGIGKLAGSLTKGG